MARRKAGEPRTHSALRESLDRRRREEADIVFGRYVRPKGHGQHVVSDPSGKRQRVVSAATGATTYRPGSQVTLGSQSGDTFKGEVLLGNAPIQERGTHRNAQGASIPVNTNLGPVIVSADPSSVTAGSTESVTLTGLRFRDAPADSFTLVWFDEEADADVADPWATISNVVVVSETEATCDIATDLDTPDDHQISIQVERAG